MGGFRHTPIAFFGGLTWREGLIVEVLPAAHCICFKRLQLLANMHLNFALKKTHCLLMITQGGLYWHLFEWFAFKLVCPPPHELPISFCLKFLSPPNSIFNAAKGDLILHLPNAFIWKFIAVVAAIKGSFNALGTSNATHTIEKTKWHLLLIFFCSHTLHVQQWLLQAPSNTTWERSLEVVPNIQQDDWASLLNHKWFT